MSSAIAPCALVAVLADQLASAAASAPLHPHAVLHADTKALKDRLGIIVGLFLALTAVQFVFTETSPTSSYVIPTQQLVLATYLLLFLIR